MSDNFSNRVALNSTTYMCICYASPEQNVDDEHSRCACRDVNSVGQFVY